MKILLTGSTGFVGRKLAKYILEQTEAILNLAVRNGSDKEACVQASNQRAILMRVGNISSGTHWHEALIGCDLVIHAAARVHVMNDQVRDPLMEFREINVEGTLNLARQAEQAGVRRFIYLSSIKVNGEYTQPGIQFTPYDVAMPEDPYSISKYEAEQGLMRLAEKSQMEIVIIRPPLVYGPGVKGNFLRMMQLLQKGIPLPLGALKENRRSFVSIDNLVNFIMICATHPCAANQVFLVSDGEDLSTTDLLCKIRKLFGKQGMLLPVPAWILNGAAILFGKKCEIMRLCGSLQVDTSKSQKLLNWGPIQGVDEALYSTVYDYIHKKGTLVSKT